MRHRVYTLLIFFLSVDSIAGQGVDQKECDATILSQLIKIPVVTMIVEDRCELHVFRNISADLNSTIVSTKNPCPSQRWTVGFGPDTPESEISNTIFVSAIQTSDVLQLTDVGHVYLVESLESGVQKLKVTDETDIFDQLEVFGKKQKHPPCHYNYHDLRMTCYIFFEDYIKEVKMSSDSLVSTLEKNIHRPPYLVHNASYSYMHGENDMILLYHPLRWFYRLNMTEMRVNNHSRVMAFHPNFEAGLSFLYFHHADEKGVVSLMKTSTGVFRTYYSMFKNVSGMSTKCLYEGFDQPVAVFDISQAEEVPNLPNPQKLMGEPYDASEDSTSVCFWIFFVVVVFIMTFIALGLLPDERDSLVVYVKSFENEIIRLTPILQYVVMAATKSKKDHHVTKKKAPVDVAPVQKLYSLPEYTGRDLDVFPWMSRRKPKRRPQNRTPSP